MTNVMTDYPIVKFPYLCGNVPDSPAFAGFIPQLIRQGYSSKKLGLLLGNSMVVTRTLFTIVTSPYHVCWGCSPNVTHNITHSLYEHITNLS